MKSIILVVGVVLLSFSLFGQNVSGVDGLPVSGVGVDFLAYNNDKLEVVKHFDGWHQLGELEGGNKIYKWIKMSYDKETYSEDFFNIIAQSVKDGIYFYDLEAWDESKTKLRFTFYELDPTVLVIDVLSEEKGVVLETMMLKGDIKF